MAENMFSEVASGIFSRVFSGILWFGVAFIIIAALSVLMWYFVIYKRKFDITVKVRSERAEDKENIIFDKAAILIDRKTRTKYFKLWGLKEELPTPPFNILQKTNRGDFMELRRTAENRWYYLLPPKIDGRYIMKTDGKIYPVTKQKTMQIDPDLDYWAEKRKGQNKGMFDPEKLWMKILPYIPIVMGGAIMIFILYILMNYLPEILAQLRELTVELNRRNTAEVTSGHFLSLIQ